MNILSLTGCSPQSGDVGVEIEMEGVNIPPKEAVYPLWRKEKDDSLRGESAEFVLRTPTPINQLDDAFAVLSGAFERWETEATPTYRAGIHVHVNVQDLTPVQLVTYIASYLVMEEVLLGFCDKTRRGNHFCLRMSDASYPLDALTSFILNEDLNSLNTEELRYASLNVTSLFKYGSIEFRALESTLDFSRIKIWAGVLTHLRDYAKTLASPVDLLGQASVLGFEQFAPVILGPWYRYFKTYATEANIRRGIRGVQYAIYARNWDTKTLNIFSKKNLFSAP